ncbi:MAG: hypothetical protein ACLRZN_04870 [Dialister invisus]
MKYIGSASAVFLLSALLLSGCNADRPAVPAKTAAVEEENTQKEKAPALQAARLGDTLDIWTAAYGAPAGDTVYMKRFNNGTVTVIVFKEHIVNITLSDPAGPSKAPPDYKDFIPKTAFFKTQRKNRMKKAATKQKCTPAFLSKRHFPCRKGSLL